MKLEPGALSSCWSSESLWEVFAHPFTAGELVAQGRLGALRVNGCRCRAELVGDDRWGNLQVRIQVVEAVAVAEPVELRRVA